MYTDKKIDKEPTADEHGLKFKTAVEGGEDKTAGILILKTHCSPFLSASNRGAIPPFAYTRVHLCLSVVTHVYFILCDIFLNSSVPATFKSWNRTVSVQVMTAPASRIYSSPAFQFSAVREQTASWTT